jgi:hypothetical protein
MNKIINFGIIALGIGILFSSLSNNALAQEVKDRINEDQAIICVNGHVVELSGNICKVFNVDDQTLNQAQEDLYNNPELDTFDMSVID